jgi:hypothetical protein
VTGTNDNRVIFLHFWELAAVIFCPGLIPVMSTARPILSSVSSTYLTL